MRRFMICCRAMAAEDSGLGLINGLVHRVNEERMTEGCMGGYGFSVFSSDSTACSFAASDFSIFFLPKVIAKTKVLFYSSKMECSVSPLLGIFSLVLPTFSAFVKLKWEFDGC